MRTATARWVKVLVCITFAGSHGSKSEGITSFPVPMPLSAQVNRMFGNWECRCLRHEEERQELSYLFNQDKIP